MLDLCQCFILGCISGVQLSNRISAKSSCSATIAIAFRAVCTSIACLAEESPFILVAQSAVQSFTANT